MGDPALDRALAAADIVIAEIGASQSVLARKVEELTARKGLRANARLVTIAASIEKDKAIPGHGITSAAWSAMSWAIGDSDRAPLTLPYDVPDYVVGINAAAAALAALVADGDVAQRTISIAAAMPSGRHC